MCRQSEVSGWVVRRLCADAKLMFKILSAEPPEPEPVLSISSADRSSDSIELLRRLAAGSVLTGSRGVGGGVLLMTSSIEYYIFF